MTIAELLRKLQGELSPLLGEFAQSDAELIIGYSLNISRTQIYTGCEKKITGRDLNRIESIVKRRLSGEPLQYILGSVYFYDREFFVNRDVLIPRPDTETLVETVLNAEKSSEAVFVDIGTGSGILAAVLTANNPAWTAVAVDISFKALRVASRNIPNNVKPLCADMLSAFKQTEKFDFLVSNPPYISLSQMQTLDKSVADYEPHGALFGGEDGLGFYRTISVSAPMVLKDNGRIYLEIGYDQGESVPEILYGNGWKNISVIKDLADRDRVVKANYK
ncbi:MAG: peptide chain release factor N(5)-glutamine methyltransferase [Chitinispirillales bacterium]|jgi:release factor glutamine methyltransferase|nr:peptide chain release factor N(5)-glutamine methyltransferase [Chitinispirillales bacterium]